MGKKVDKRARAKEFLTEFVAVHPEGEERTKAEELVKFLTADNSSEKAASLLSDGILRQDEFSRTMDEGREALSTKEKEVSTALEAIAKERKDVWGWYDSAKPRLDHYDQLVREGKIEALTKTGTKPGEKPGEKPAVTATTNGTGISQEDLDKKMQEFAGEAVPVMAVMSHLGMRHYKEFGEILSPKEMTELTQHTDVTRLGLEGVYDLVHKDKYDTKAKEADDKRIEEIKAEAHKAGMAAQAKAAGPGYPVAGSVEPAMPDLFEQTDEQRKAADAESDPAAMAAAYRAKVAETSADDPGFVG